MQRLNKNDPDWMFDELMTWPVKRILIHCAICGRDCTETGRGWYCAPCDAFTETDVEVEE